MLRRLGYSISIISAAFGRSTSCVMRILRKNGLRGDLRKLPQRIRLLAAQKQRLGMIKYLQAWELWAQGVGEKPP